MPSARKSNANSPDMRTLVITSFHSFISKNILNTDVLRTLRDERETRIVIFVPKEKAEFFARHYAGGNVEVEGIDTARITRDRANTFFSRLFFLMIDSHYLRYKRVERRDVDPTPASWIKYYAFGALAAVLSGSKALNRAARALFMRLSSRGLLAVHLDRVKPDLVFSTDVFDPNDIQVLKEASLRGIRTVGMIRSWDNCWSKGLLPVIPDRLLANNAVLKDEAVTLHDVPAERIAVVGLPQFDAFVREARTPRDAFFARIGVDPSKRLILLAPAGTILSDTDWQLCDILERAIRDGKLPEDVHVFVRNHPHHPADLSRFQGSPHFTFQNPGHVFGAVGKSTELEPEEHRFLGDLLFHSAVVAWVATSLGLDAAVFDKPEIMIDFDGYEKKEYFKSVARYRDEDHMLKLVATGGARRVKEPEEFVAAVKAYLDDPSLDRDGRKRIVEEQLYRIDGKSGERVVREVLSALG